MNKRYVEIGNRIRNRRKECRIKQSELAERLNISNNHLSSIENGREKPSLDLFLEICIALQATPDYLLLGNVYPSNIPQNIIEGLRLCTDEDIKVIRDIVEIYVKRNSEHWNSENTI